jgi:hypothetical protein
MPTLTTDEVKALDPYAFLAVLGKTVIHPGGRAAPDPRRAGGQTKGRDRGQDE